MLKSNLKKGVKCVIVANNSSHGKEIGIVVTLERSYNGGGGSIGYYTKEFGGTWFASNDLEIYEQSIGDIEEDLESLMSKIKILNEKKEYLKSFGLEKLNIEKYKEWQLSKIIEEDDISSEEKASLIMDIFANKVTKKKVKRVPRKVRKDVDECDEVEELEIEMDGEEV